MPQYTVRRHLVAGAVVFSHHRPDGREMRRTHCRGSVQILPVSGGGGAAAPPQLPGQKGKTVQTGGAVTPGASVPKGGDALLNNVFSAFDQAKRKAHKKRK